MQISGKVWLLRVVVAFICVGIWTDALSAPAVGATAPHYVVTNDDVTFTNGVSFYSLGSDGNLTLVQQVVTNGTGIGGGFFGTNRLSLLNSASNECIYAADASSADIAGIDVTTLTSTSNIFGSTTDDGSANGIGLAMNQKYLYAGYTTSNTIGTFKVQPGCSLKFGNDISVAGLQGGAIEGMALHGSIMVVTYGDGSIESFNVSAGTPVSNGDLQNSNAFRKSQGATYPTSVEITQDGHFAVFGDTSSSTVVEVSDISSGKLSPTIIYTQQAPMNSSNILLSPDETLLYVANTEGDSITALYFDTSTGKLTPGCTSGKLRGYSRDWSYLASMALEKTTGTGSVVYVAEFGSSIAMVHVSSGGGKCTLKEAPASPISDPNSTGLLSITSFPPRSF